MNQIWVFTFHGIWPVGACGYVVAPTREEADRLVWERFHADRLGSKNTDFTLEAPVDLEQPGVVIVLSGDY